MKSIIVLIIVILGIVSNISSESTSRIAISKINMKRYMNRFGGPFPVKVLSTPVNDWGNSATIYLDRHNLDCKAGVMNWFHYKRNGNNKFNYEYGCAMPRKCDAFCEKKIRAIDSQKCKLLTTPANKIGNQNGKSTNYLDRHHLKCPTNYALQGFQFQRKQPNILFKYKCCPAKLTNCKTLDTPNSDFGDYGTIYLDRQRVSVPDPRTQAITGFQLHTDYKKHGYSYKLEYCTITG